MRRSPAADKPKGPLYNTAKQELLQGKQVFSFTQSKAALGRRVVFQDIFGAREVCFARP